MARPTRSTRPRLMASRWARRKCGSRNALMAGQRMPGSSSRTGCARLSTAASANAARRRAAGGRSSLPTNAGDFEAETPSGRNLHFGVREHAMAAIVNGLSLSKLRAFGATFVIFSDYARPAIRLSALMELPTIWVLTHDAMGDGEDGPTHQPVEHLVSLRAIPGLVVLRPGDANEVVEAYRYVMQLRHQPAVLALARQPLPTFD